MLNHDLVVLCMNIRSDFHTTGKMSVLQIANAFRMHNLNYINSETMLTQVQKHAA
jgi:hypothetical protein